jgi:hypothetical protein
MLKKKSLSGKRETSGSAADFIGHDAKPAAEPLGCRLQSALFGYSDKAPFT